MFVNMESQKSMINMTKERAHFGDYGEHKTLHSGILYHVARFRFYPNNKILA